MVLDVLVGVECGEENRPFSGQQHQAQFGLNPALYDTEEHRVKISSNSDKNCRRRRCIVKKLRTYRMTESHYDTSSDNNGR